MNGSEEWKRSRNHDFGENLELIGCLRQGHLHQPAAYIAHAGVGIDDDWEKTSEENDRHFRGKTQPEPENDQGYQRYVGRRVKRANLHVEQLIKEAVASHQQPKQRPEHNSQRQPYGH